MPGDKYPWWITYNEETDDFKVVGHQHREFGIGNGVEIKASNKKFAKRFCDIYYIEIIDIIESKINQTTSEG